jgi:hypothetical protein
MNTLTSQEIPVCAADVITQAQAENALRAIARRNGQTIRKRRSSVLKQQYGAGYGIVDIDRNYLLSGGMTSDGCDFYLENVARFYKDDPDNTAHQNKVIAAVLDDLIEN